MVRAKWCVCSQMLPFDLRRGHLDGLRVVQLSPLSFPGQRAIDSTHLTQRQPLAQQQYSYWGWIRPLTSSHPSTCTGRETKNWPSLDRAVIGQWLLESYVRKVFRTYFLEWKDRVNCDISHHETCYKHFYSHKQWQSTHSSWQFVRPNDQWANWSGLYCTTITLLLFVRPSKAVGRTKFTRLPLSGEENNVIRGMVIPFAHRQGDKVEVVWQAFGVRGVFVLSSQDTKKELSHEWNTILTLVLNTQSLVQW